MNADNNKMCSRLKAAKGGGKGGGRHMNKVQSNSSSTGKKELIKNKFP